MSNNDCIIPLNIFMNLLNISSPRELKYYVGTFLGVKTLNKTINVFHCSLIIIIIIPLIYLIEMVLSKFRIQLLG